MKESLIRKSVQSMAGYTPGEQPADKLMVKLNTNENPYPPSPRIFRAIRAFDAGKLRLYPNPVSMKLRRKIAGIHSCGIENVFVGNGSDEILALCTRAFVEDSGSIGYFNPSYSLYPVLADIRDVQKRPVELGVDFKWQMPGSYKASLFFLANPNAPTSMLHPKDEIKKFCATFKGVVLIDEAYADFSKENCMDLALKFRNTLVMRTLSKSFSLAGLRVGYVVGAKPLIEALFKIKDSYNLDAFSQMVAMEALSDIKYMKSNVSKIRDTRVRLAEALRVLGYLVYPSETNFLWVKPAGISAKHFFERLRKRKIFVRYFEGPRTGDYVRITVGTNSDVDKLLLALGKFA